MLAAASVAARPNFSAVACLAAVASNAAAATAPQ